MEPLLQALLHRHSAAKSVIGEETIKNLHQELDSCAKQLKSAIHASNDVQIAASWNRIKKSKKLAQLACLANLKTKEWPKSLPELEALSKDIVLGKSSGETVLVYAVAKFGFFDSTPNPIVGQKPKKKEFRSIMSFGRKKRAKNWLIYTLLDMVQSNPTGNFLYKRLGTGRLSDAIKAEFESGKSWVVLFDASNFYSSVQGTKWVSEKLKMPVNVALEELFTSPETHLMLGECLTMHSQAQFLEAARLGLPQGLATSLIVGRIVYEDVLTTLFPMKRYFFYGDDGIIFASCKSDAVAIANTLRGAFESHPAGPFALKRCKVLITT